MKLLLLLVPTLCVVAVCGQDTKYKVDDYLEVSRNDYRSNDVSGRSRDPEDAIEEVVKGHDVTLSIPVIGATATFTAKNLDRDEMDVKVKFGSGNQVEARKKSKLKKIFVPILVFVLLKAMVVIPLALGILAIKTWNAIQLSFVSFVLAFGMAVWQLCKKVAGDSHHPQIIAHDPWAEKQYIARAMDAAPEAQRMAYSAQVPRQ